MLNIHSKKLSVAPMMDWAGVHEKSILFNMIERPNLEEPYLVRTLGVVDQEFRRLCHKWRCAVSALFLVILWPLAVLAHSPYFGQSERIELTGYGAVEFTILYGDGIFFADPSQVVVLDSEGYLLAATPQSRALLISCHGQVPDMNCFVYDKVNSIIYEPDLTQWARGRLMVKEGRPSGDAYPEYIDIEYGFTQRPATFFEALSFEVTGVKNAPAATVFSVIWWGAAWFLLARSFWRWRQAKRQFKPVSGWDILRAAIGLVVLFTMFVISVYGWLLNPYTEYYFWFVFVSGAMASFALARPKLEVDPDNQR